MFKINKPRKVQKPLQINHQISKFVFLKSSPDHIIPGKKFLGNDQNISNQQLFQFFDVYHDVSRLGKKTRNNGKWPTCELKPKVTFRTCQNWRSIGITRCVENRLCSASFQDSILYSSHSSNYSARLLSRLRHRLHSDQEYILTLHTTTENTHGNVIFHNLLN